MELVLVAAAGVHHPEMGQLQIEVATHQGEQTTEHDRLQLGAIGGADHTAGGLGRIARHVVATHHTDGPVLHRLGDRGNGVGAHGEEENAPEWDGRIRANVASTAGSLRLELHRPLPPGCPLRPAAAPPSSGPGPGPSPSAWLPSPAAGGSAVNRPAGSRWTAAAPPWCRRATCWARR